MSEGLSRRDLVAVAGTSIALAACNKTGDTGKADSCLTIKDDTIPGTNNGPYKMRGYPAVPYGDDPHDQPPKEFKPAFISVLHIAANGLWSYDINYAHFEIQQNLNDAERLEQAIIRLEKKISSPRKSSFGKISEQNLKPYVKMKTDVGKQCDYLEMEPLEFNSENEIFIFIESGKVGLDDKKLISFSNGLSDGSLAAENYSFYWARLVPQNDLGSIKNNGQMIRLRNYCLDAGGNSQIGKPELKHSLNIHFGAPLKSRGFVPMVIDPDTGNGSGNEP